MRIGGSIFLLAVGAIIAFAFNLRVGWMNLDVVGWILMAAGALGLVVTLGTRTSRSRTVVSTTPPGPPAVDGTTTQERTTYQTDQPL
jgi:hypothetical protein